MRPKPLVFLVSFLVAYCNYYAALSCRPEWCMSSLRAERTWDMLERIDTQVPPPRTATCKSENNGACFALLEEPKMRREPKPPSQWVWARIECGPLTQDTDSFLTADCDCIRTSWYKMSSKSKKILEFSFFIEYSTKWIFGKIYSFEFLKTDIFNI